MDRTEEDSDSIAQEDSIARELELEQVTEYRIYKVVTIDPPMDLEWAPKTDREIERILNAFGRDGWEVVHIWPMGRYNNKIRIVASMVVENGDTT